MIEHGFKVLCAAGLLLVATSCATASLESGAERTLEPVRRIVTTEDRAGRSYVLADGPATNVLDLNGSRIERLWETTGLPVPIPVETDLGATAGNAYRPGFNGSSLYVADIPAGSNLSDIPLHKQESMDYIVLLEGEIDLVLDGGRRVAMRRGDVLVQAGNNHSWINTGKTTARLLCVTMTGVRASPASATL